jgi:hypothetical protein
VSKKSKTKSKRRIYVQNYLSRLCDPGLTLYQKHELSRWRKDDDPWRHVEFEDLLKTCQLWRDVYMTAMPLMQFLEQVLGTPVPKKFGDEPK